MLEKYPYENNFWEDRRAKVEKINIPAYVVDSSSTAMHVFGSLRSFEAIRNVNKWYVMPGVI
jgi:predicted acyl esterase